MIKADNGTGNEGASALSDAFEGQHSTGSTGPSKRATKNQTAPKTGNTPTNRSGQANNRVSVEGAGALNDALKINITLTTLDLRGVQKQLDKTKRGHDTKKLVRWPWTMLKQATRSQA